MSSRPAPVAIVGPTASGKSTLALALARRRPGAEIVSVDSMGVYRGMDIGTAKPTPSVRADVPHHLVDVADPAEDYSVARFQSEAEPVLADLRARDRPVLLVGGTGLYLRALVDGLTLPGRWPRVAAALEADADGPGGVPALHARLAHLDPVAAGRIVPTNRRRVVRALEVTLGSGRPFSSYGPGLTAYPPSPVRLIGLWPTREALAARIARRVEAQAAAGWLEEVRGLAARAGGLSRTARQALGYRELLAHVEEGRPLEEALAATVARTRSFARRQLSWF
ncbi:MAG TPA: tRNA (adenosine(37)-N6)-dimethylallyltransferase MiaA, partial [Acidimicrobiales bacterium]|nr:tRNA (adenosine(37)-N6)-dimethylallyltransferase MiaA [Acidimicrobiales bacterium]